MPFDPAQPANNSPLVSQIVRDQLNGLKALIDAILTITAAQVDGVNTGNPGDPANVAVNVVGNTLHFTFTIPRGNDGASGADGAPGEVSNQQLSDAIAGTSNNTNAVSTLGQSADGSYNQQQMQDVLNKLDELINAARR